MLTVVRHGSTKLNSADDEKMRGWLNVPLSQLGKEESLKAGEKLKSLNLDIKDFHTSPLMRAKQTADTISSETGIDNTVSDHLKDWNTGDLTGKSVKENLPIIHDHIENPERPLPGGESYESFVKRAVPFLRPLVESNDNHLIVTHNRITTLLKALSNNRGTHPDNSIMKRKGPIEPGGILTIYPDWSSHIIYGGSSSTDKRNG